MSGLCASSGVSFPESLWYLKVTGVVSSGVALAKERRGPRAEESTSARGQKHEVRTEELL